MSKPGSKCVQGLYDERESSMDELGGFEPTDTTGFIKIQSIRLKKCVFFYMALIACVTILGRWGQANAKKGQGGIEPKDVYGTRV